MKQLLLLVLLCLTLPTAHAQKSRDLSSGRIGLEIEGQFVGWVKSADGGGPVADVVQEKAGGGQAPKKHLAGVHYDPIHVECYIDALPALAEWLRDTKTQGKPRRNGALIVADFNYKAVTRLEFQNALLTEFSLPALDATSKEAGLISVTFQPENTRPVDGKGASTAALSGKTKALLANNFRLTIPGVDCSRVSKISAITYRQKVAAGGAGAYRELSQGGQLVEIPDLTLAVAESAAGPFASWLQDFVVKGNNTDSQEREGKLELLAPDLKEVLLTINLKHLGIYRIADDKTSTTSQLVQLYLEDFELILAGK
ncbi:phage tail protein [Armatimonas rosea]|uniref:Uncharacterized protein n=1 Tax=Armatimonas rosea TaxID=685828 RepID=A0A7W9SMY1_ARMRO|nr:phage tail protein [Armatimonas rosea]MBB6049581.1 hypothetical protein [Armatimonas rosea]